MFDVDVVVYIASRMTGRDKAETVKRAEYVCKVFKEYGITPISPVIEENIKPDHNKLVNHDKETLRSFWKRDKQIIIEEAHVVMLDHAEMKSFGMEREYGLNRDCLWKPTVILVPQNTALSVAQFEDDAFYYSVHHAAQDIVKLWGTRWDRWVWRIKMLNRTLPKWLWRQVLAWR